MPRKVTPAVLAGGVVIVASSIALALALPDSDGSGTSGTSSDISTAASPTDPVEQCVVTVMDLMKQSLQAMQNGYHQGIDPNDVAARYGYNSRVRYAFAQSQAKLQPDAYTNGENGALTRIQPVVKQWCESWRPQS